MNLLRLQQNCKERHHRVPRGQQARFELCELKLGHYREENCTPPERRCAWQCYRYPKEITAYYVKGVEASTANADMAVNKAVELSGKGVVKVAANAGSAIWRDGQEDCR